MLLHLFGESDYEMNEVCVLKKIAAFFVTLATDKEPESGDELREDCLKWQNE